MSVLLAVVTGVMKFVNQLMVSTDVPVRRVLNVIWMAIVFHSVSNAFIHAMIYI